MQRFLRKYGTLLALLGLIVLFSLLRGNVFCTLRNFINITQQIAILMMVAISATYILAIAEFDLSLSALVSFVGVLATGLMVKGMHPIPAVFLALSATLLFGFLNGTLVAFLRLPSFVTTLAMGTLVSGVTFWYSGGTIIFSGIPKSFTILGQGSLGKLPFSSLLMFFLLALSAYLLTYTTLGKAIYAVGGNETAAWYSGIRVARVKIFAFLLSALHSGLAGIVLASRLGSAHPTGGGGYLMPSYAAAFLGTTLFREGEANIWGTFVGALIMGVLANGLTILNVPYFLQDILTGIILIGALVLRASRKREE
ncbi:MAG: ABC transporter permease [Candidatus Caldatribacterium sp.]|uniref:ABC transporter permease n=1 Tax=Candidatus Caldatribacterium sp. TaxID=2282143 RepID=UPI0029923ABC|nr:ABC transporter permease [Candidatus Caldatribacterium sp.]MCX7729847.1 ABC transporter permease [Candidatus Caldatribacterium sp.]MDW8081286.1 ABC transporter permease [Candidatus Calescibacterium sp.]